MTGINGVYMAREYVRKRLVDVKSGFNALIKQTAQVYGVSPFVLDTDSQPQTLYLGRYTMYDVVKTNTPAASSALPFAILSAAKADSIGQEGMRITPSVFSGQVIISLDFYVSYEGDGFPPDGDAMFNAVFDALAGALNSRDSYNTVPNGMVYNNEILVEQGKMEFSNTRWIQQIPCAISFQTVV